jgi:hypothetical protein
MSTIGQYKIAGILALLGLACVTHAQTDVADPLRTSTDVLVGKDSTKLENNAPHEVLKLSQWPGQSVLSGDQAVSEESPEVAFANQQTTSWIEKVFATPWLPPDGTQRYFLKNEFDGRDVVRMKWQHAGYGIEVSQTRMVFVLKVTPIGGGGTGTDETTKLAFARDVALKMFASTGRRWSQDKTGAGVAVPVPGLAQKIVSWSFGRETARSLSDAGTVVGRPRTMQEEGVPVSNDEVRANERKPDNPQWYRSSLSWRYWFRRVHWWNDGSSVVIYFLKVEEGVWQASYGQPNADRDFFGPPKDRMGRPILSEESSHSGATAASVAGALTSPNTEPTTAASTQPATGDGDGQ